jgi:hypothetical protein
VPHSIGWRPSGGACMQCPECGSAVLVSSERRVRVDRGVESFDLPLPAMALILPRLRRQLHYADFEINCNFNSNSVGLI